MTDKNYITDILTKEEYEKLENENPNIFNFEAKYEGEKLCVGFSVDNPCCEDHYEEFEIEKASRNKMREDFKREIFEIYDRYDVDEEVEMFLEAKRNGFSGVPCASNLVHNCENIQDTLCAFTNSVTEIVK